MTDRLTDIRDYPYGLSYWITESAETKPLSVFELNQALQEIWDTTPGANVAYMDKDRFLALKGIVRAWYAKYSGVRIRGCKGTRIVRFRKDRWQVV